MTTIKRALLSVSDKTGLVELAQGLSERGVELVASGGTSRLLRESGLTVTSVADLTGYPELLGGRVKTLHPAVHGGILSRDSDADRAELAGHNLAPIDLVVCNLYPFEETVARPDVTFADAIEQIDIGGVTLLRAAAKNCSRVTILCDVADYPSMVEQIDQGIDAQWRVSMGRKAFAHTARYDAAISAWFADQDDEQGHDALPARHAPAAERQQILRYGENPHQEAALYSWEGEALPFTKLQGKALSYNNLVDLDGALDAVQAFEEPAVAIIKHTNPCGLAVGEDLIDAYKKALASDPVSAFGSIIAVNRPVDIGLLDVIGKLFVEVIAAPSFSAEALEWLGKRKKNCRAVRIDDITAPQVQVRTIRGGLLLQTMDNRPATPEEWRWIARCRRPNCWQFIWAAKP